MSLGKKPEEDDYYCLVECECGRKYKPEEMLFCACCKKIRCNFCLITEANLFQCKGFCTESLSASSKNKLTCDKCLECPLCFTPLIKKLYNNKFYLFCTGCYWNSQNVHISKEKKEEFENYIQILHQEKNSGFFRGMYESILTQLNEENIFSQQSDKNTINFDLNKNDFDANIVQKAMEKSEQTFEEFDKRIKEEKLKNEKKIGGKIEYNDDYLIKEENNENKNFKKKNKLLSCYNDFNQNFNSLDEVKKALNSNLSISSISSLEQRHHNAPFQNNSIWNQFPKFVDLIPKKKDYLKKCKDCEKAVIIIPESQNSKDGVLQTYIGSLPLIYIHKIDWDNLLITLKFVLVNFIDLTISFAADPLNNTKIILPNDKFLIQDERGYKKILIDFKFDEKYKNEFVKNNLYFFRFILKAEDNSSCIEYPVEIKFK